MYLLQGSSRVQCAVHFPDPLNLIKPKLDQTLICCVLFCHRDHDVFNALDIFQNASFLKELKFGIGDGRLRYYLYNWRISQQLTAEEVGLVLL